MVEEGKLLNALKNAHASLPAIDDLQILYP